MLRKNSLSNEEFLKRLRDYLPMDAVICALDRSGRQSVSALSTDLIESRFFYFDAESILAASHAIEELALEEANGRLFASIQDFKQFVPQRERYWQLGATLEEVRVIASGRKPGRHGHLRFVQANGAGFRDFWMVLYQGRRAQVLFLAQQTNASPVFEEKKFLGFYSLNPAVIARMRQQWEYWLKGRLPGLTEFDRLQRLDQAGREIRTEFCRQQQVVVRAINRLQIEGDDYPVEKFSADFARALKHLDRLRLRVSKALQRTPSKPTADD